MSKRTDPIRHPLSTLEWVKRDTLKANDYNPNRVSEANLDLLVQSIMVNGWTAPVVVRPGRTIIDGFHRWTVSGRPELRERLNGEVPIVTVAHADQAADMYGTITHNRARGVHLLEPMMAIVRKLIDSGRSVQEISKQLGMRPEEIFRLSGASREDFLTLMARGVIAYSPARLITDI